MLRVPVILVGEVPDPRQRVLGDAVGVCDALERDLRVDGLFEGNVTIMVDDTDRLSSLMKKLSAVKGVKQISRL